MQDVFSIPRNALRENQQIWIATSDEKLGIREVEVLWRDSARVIIQNGLTDGEQLIVSDLTAPMNGMDVDSGKHTELQQNASTEEAK